MRLRYGFLPMVEERERVVARVRVDELFRTTRWSAGRRGRRAWVWRKEASSSGVGEAGVVGEGHADEGAGEAFPGAGVSAGRAGGGREAYFEDEEGAEIPSRASVAGSLSAFTSSEPLEPRAPSKGGHDAFLHLGDEIRARPGGEMTTL